MNSYMAIIEFFTIYNGPLQISHKIKTLTFNLPTIDRNITYFQRNVPYVVPALIHIQSL